MPRAVTPNSTSSPSLAMSPLGYPLLPDESPDILVDVRAVVPQADRWLDAPNTLFAGDTPRSLIGTDREVRLREVLRAILYGLYS